MPVPPRPDTSTSAARPVTARAQDAVRAPDRAVTSGDAGASASEPAQAQPMAADGSTPSPAAVPPAAAYESNGGGVRWWSFADAVDESRRTGKPLLLDFNADWCGPCQRMKHEVFESASHARAIENAVLPVTVVDRRREMGANPADLDQLQAKFQIHAFPTLVVLCPATGKAARQEGYGGPDMTEAWIAQAAQAVKQ